MGTEIYFFTDVDLLEEQIAEQAFGPIENMASIQFRVSNLFSVTNKANIYAICRGKKLTYQDGTVILYPYDEMIFDGLPVQYFIYSNVDASNVTTKIILEDESNDLLIAQQYKYSEYLESVVAGDKIAETINHRISISVVVTGVDDGLRAFEKSIDCVTVNEDENSKRKREKILNYMDISAFYGMFVYDKIGTKQGSNVVHVYKTKEAITNNILSKFWNRNKIYVDIRDSRYYSLNYRKSTAECHTIEIQGNATSNTEEGVYPQWPLLTIEKTAGSSNTTSLPLKYDEMIIQIPNVGKTYCIFGYKRKGKKLKKQRLYDTSEVTVSIPVVDGNYVSSYYRYMVDTDVTNQEGLNGLFQVRPFEEYTCYYYSSAEVQSWLTGRLCFYEDTVVACGIALDKRQEIENKIENRINFFAIPIQDSITNIKSTNTLLNTNICNSNFDTFFSVFSAEIQLLKINTKIYNEENAVEDVLTLAYSSTKSVSLICLSMTLQELRGITMQIEDEFSDLTIEKVGITIKNRESNNQEKPLYPLLLRKYIIKCGKFSTQNILKAYTYDSNRTLLTTIHATELEKIEAREVGIIYFQQSDDATYPNDCVGEERIELQKKEFYEIEDAFATISKFNSIFYNELMCLLYSGIDIYPDGIRKKYYPQIIVKYGDAKGNNAAFILSENSYEKSYNLNSSSLIRIINEKKTFDNEIVKDYIKYVLDDCYVIEGNKTISRNVEWLHIGEKCIDGTKSWLPKFQILDNEFNTIDCDIKTATRYGVAILKSHLNIVISQETRMKMFTLDKKLTIKCDGYTNLQFMIASLLIHELSHVYERVSHMVEDFLWSSFYSVLPSVNDVQKQYPSYRNISIGGHILGNPSSTKSIKEQLKFEEAWQKYFYENLREHVSESFLSKILNTRVIKEVYTVEDDFLKCYYLNKNNLIYEEK